MYPLNTSLPSYVVMGAVLNARVLPPCGNVVNDSAQFSFGKWYWDPQSSKGASQCHNAPSLLHVRKSDVVATLGPNGAPAAALVSLVSFATSEFSHVVMDSLPKASAVCTTLSLETVAILVSGALQQNLVRLVCPDASRFLLLPKKRAMSAPVVYLPFVPATPLGIYPQRTLQPMALPRPCGDTSPVPRQLGLQHVRRFDCAPPSDLIYLWRPRGVRSVTDHQRLLETLDTAWSRCGRVVLVEPGSWAADRRRMSGARVVVAPHGGAVANIAFAPPGAHLIELITRKGLKERPCYYGLAHALDFTYEYIEPSRFSFFKPMTLGPHALARIDSTLRAMCDGLLRGRQAHAPPPQPARRGNTWLNWGR